MKKIILSKTYCCTQEYNFFEAKKTSMFNCGMLIGAKFKCIKNKKVIRF